MFAKFLPDYLACLLFVHIYGKKITKRQYSFYVYESMKVYCTLAYYLYTLHIHVFLHIPYNQTQATFLVFSIAIGPKCSYNFVPPMNSSNQTFNEIHKRQVLITNLQYSKDFNLILNRFNLIRFNCFKKEIIRVINNEESRVETGTQTGT